MSPVRQVYEDIATVIMRVQVYNLTKAVGCISLAQMFWAAGKARNKGIALGLVNESPALHVSMRMRYTLSNAHSLSRKRQLVRQLIKSIVY